MSLDPGGRALKDFFEWYGRFELDELKSKISPMAKGEGRRGLCFMERTAIVPADVWVERKLCLMGDYEVLDRLCASEEMTWIL